MKTRHTAFDAQGRKVLVHIPTKEEETAEHVADRDAALAEITRDILRLQTLETRGRDHLDFHDLSVAQIRRALQAAYEAGRRA